MKSRLKAPGTKRLNLEYDGLLSNFGFRFNLRPYILGVTVLLLTCSYNDTEFIRVGRALPVCLRCTGVPVYLCTCVPVYPPAHWLSPAASRLGSMCGWPSQLCFGRPSDQTVGACCLLWRTCVWGVGGYTTNKQSACVRCSDPACGILREQRVRRRGAARGRAWQILPAASSNAF